MLLHRLDSTPWLFENTAQLGAPPWPCHKSRPAGIELRDHPDQAQPPFLAVPVPREIALSSPEPALVTPKRPDHLDFYPRLLPIVHRLACNRAAPERTVQSRQAHVSHSDQCRCNDRKVPRPHLHFLWPARGAPGLEQFQGTQDGKRSGYGEWSRLHQPRCVSKPPKPLLIALL